jgi:hypothetical protein
VSEIARAVERVEGVSPCSEQSNLSAEGLARLAVERGEQARLHRPEAAVERREELGAELGGDDSPSSAIGGIGPTLDQLGSFEVIEEVRHDRSVHSEVLGQSELATYRALGGGGEDLVSPGATRKVGHRVVCGRGVSPKDHPQSPPEVACQRADAAGRVPAFVALTRDVIHHPIIAE